MSILQEYNGRDTIATYQLWEVFQNLLESDPFASQAYAESMALHNPVLYMMLRGILVDEEVLASLRDQFTRECLELEACLDRLTKPLLGCVINMTSNDQLSWMFSCLGVETESTDTEHLEGIANGNPDLSIFCRIILHWRDRNTMLTRVLVPGLVDADHRMRTTYKIGGTVTRRLSSSKNCLWTGMNLQNVKRDQDETKSGHASIRSIFVADPGYRFLNIDLERADSWAVGLEVYQTCGDPSYLDACASADLHTYVCKLIWPDLGWTGDPKADKEIASGFFYRQYDYRFMAKKGGHGSNYLGKPWTLARQMKIPTALAISFQEAYFEAFPGIPQWHAAKAKELQTTACLTNLCGIRRRFHDRLDSDATIREAIAYLGQSVTSTVINRGFIRLWDLVCRRPDLGIEPLGQVHDSALIQIPETTFEQALPLILESLTIPLVAKSPTGEIRTYTIPLEVAVGWNWSGLQKDKTGKVYNPDGLIKLKEGQRDDRRRIKTPRTPGLKFMDRRISGLHRRAS